MTGTMKIETQLLTSMATLNADVNTLKIMVTKIDTTLHGNGRPGIISEVQKNSSFRKILVTGTKTLLAGGALGILLNFLIIAL